MYFIQPSSSNNLLHNDKDLDQRLIELIIGRVIVLLLWLNLSHRLGLLPDNLGSFPFLQFFNVLALSLALLYLIGWCSHKHRLFQLYCQVAIDLILVSLLVAYTRGTEGPFVSLYLLIIVYCSLALGRNGGLIGAALSTIFYSGIVIAINLGFPDIHNAKIDTSLAFFRTAVHALSFWAVAYLGMYLNRRLRAMERVLIEQMDSLTQLQHLNEHIVSSIRSGLITTDRNGQIAVFNTAAGDLTGKKSEEVLGQSIAQIIGQDFWARIQAEDLLKNAKPLRHEGLVQLPNGTKRFLGFSVSPLLDKNRQSLGYIFSFQDLTEIMRLEEEIRLKERMAAIGRMAAAIAHEIRNPLTAMSGSVEILRSHANLPENDARLLNILIRESDRLNKFIEDFLNFARPRTCAKNELDVVPILRDSVTLLKNSPDVKGKYSVILNIEAHAIRILGSADQLSQVFWNLAQNAIRAMPNGGVLTISTGKLSEEFGQILFEDTGIGMSREEMEQTFQPFHSGFSGGLGLGLSIIFQIMEDHRAKISFESEKRKGTKAILHFPLLGRSPQFESFEQISKG
jgi:two-component system, NtrC family, sensor histidine kinase PilS